LRERHIALADFDHWLLAVAVPFVKSVDRVGKGVANVARRVTAAGRLKAGVN
jgi:hypothetical protein